MINHLDTFRELLKQGLTPLEALRQFDPEDLRAAVFKGLDEGSMDLFRLAVRANREQMNEADLDQAIELWLAGWTSETPHQTQTDIFSWYWRSPPKRKGKGRRYLSTQQALNALRRQKSASSPTTPSS